MKKDIEIPIAKDVYVAVVHEWNDEFLAKEWNTYIINGGTSKIELIIVVSKGYDDERKTSTMRRSIKSLETNSSEKVELLYEDLFSLNNEFFVTYFADNKMFEKRFVFEKNSISENALTMLPIIEKDGILAT